MTDEEILIKNRDGCSLPLLKHSSDEENEYMFEMNELMEKEEIMTKKHMTAEEKGYKCPDLEDCTQCGFYKDLCIVYGKTGKKNYKKRLETQQKTVKNQ